MCTLYSLPLLQKGIVQIEQDAIGWPLYDIATINIVSCMAYKRVVGGGGILRNSRAIVKRYCG